MPPVEFAPDSEDLALRLTSALLALCGVFAVAGVAALWIATEPGTTAMPAFVAALGLYAMAAIAALATPRPAPGDGLRLDDDGLTVTHRGHRRHWRWDALGAFTLDRRSGPAGLVLGQRISIHTPPEPDPARRAVALRLTGEPPGEVVVVGGYLGAPDEVAEALEAFRDRHVGRLAPDQTHVAGSTATFHPRDQQHRRAETRTAVVPGIFSWLGVYAGASAVAGFIEGWAAFVDHWIDPMSHPFILTIGTLLSLFYAWTGVRGNFAGKNRILVDAEGLQVSSNGRRRRWRWDQVSAPELQQEPAADGGGSKRYIGFIAGHDGLSSDGARPPDLLPAALRHRIEDVYDAPLATIAGRIAGNRRRALSEAAEATVAAPGMAPLPT